MSETEPTKTERQRTLDYIASLEREIADIDRALQASRRSAKMLVSLNEGREGEEDSFVAFNVHDPHWRVCLHSFRYHLERLLGGERTRLADLQDLGLDHLRFRRLDRR